MAQKSFMRSILPFSRQQYVGRPRATIPARSRAKGQHFLALGQPLVDALLEYRLSVRSPSLAMNDAHTTVPGFETLVKKLTQRLAGIAGAHAV